MAILDLNAVIRAGGNSSLLPEVKTASYNAVAGGIYGNKTTAGAITATLPANPNVGDTFLFIDYARTYGTNSFTINPNGNKIATVSGSWTLSTNNINVELTYIDAVQGYLATNYFTWTPPVISSGDALTASALSTNLAWFNAAAPGSVVEITAAEYANLKAIAGTSIINASDAQMALAAQAGSNGAIATKIRRLEHELSLSH